MEPAQQVLIPLWPALGIGFTLISALIAVVVWSFMTFERREDAKNKRTEDFASLQSYDRRITILEEMRSDVSFIRGMIEGKNADRS